MKPSTLLFILLFQSVLLSAQKHEELRSASYYESLSRTGDSCNSYNYSLLASVYIRAKKQLELKRTYERAVKCPLKNDMQREFYLELADIYLSERQFRKALDLIILFDSTRYKVMRNHNPFQHVSNFTLATKRSICYKGMGTTDSAIYELTPYMFYKHTHFEGFYDSLSYDSILKSYLALLRSKYSAADLRRELQQAEKNFYFEILIDKGPNSFGSTLHKFNCLFSFFTRQITYLDTGLSIRADETVSYPLDWNLADQFNRFKQAPLYRMIMSL